MNNLQWRPDLSQSLNLIFLDSYGKKDKMEIRHIARALPCSIARPLSFFMRRASPGVTLKTTSPWRGCISYIIQYTQSKRICNGAA